MSLGRIVLGKKVLGKIVIRKKHQMRENSNNLKTCCFCIVNSLSTEIFQQPI